MFGMGFMEIMIIAIIAVIFLGPEKLPEALINIAKFFRSFKTTIADAKNSIEQEMNISELKKEALGFKNELTSATSEIERIKDMANLDLPDFEDDFKPGLSPTPTPENPVETKNAKGELLEDLAVEPEKEVTFKKQTKAVKEDDEKVQDTSSEEIK